MFSNQTILSLSLRFAGTDHITGQNGKTLATDLIDEIDLDSKRPIHIKG